MLNEKFPNGVAGYSYHNHSRFSDGICSMEEMLLAAKASGIREYGFSDHWNMRPECYGGIVSWSIRRERIQEYLKCARELKAKYSSPEFSVKIGLEVDYYDENIEDVISELERFGLDYAIGSTHSVGRFNIDGDEDEWKKLSQEEIDDIIEKYWQTNQKIANSGFFDIIAHIDLCKIYGYSSSRDMRACALGVMEAARDKGTAIEINTAGWDKKCGCCYPAPHLIEAGKKMGVQFVISADAHKTEHIVRHFDKAVALLAGH